MTSNNPLTAVHITYLTTRDGLSIAERTIRARQEALTSSTRFAGISVAQAERAIERARSQVKEHAVLALFVVFERFVVEHVRRANQWLAAGYPREYAKRMSKKFGDEVEYWRFAELLDLFKSDVSVHVIGEIKQMKHYRDWIAHRNPAKSSASRIEPDLAFEVLSDAISAIQKSHAFDDVALDGDRAASA